MIGAPPESKPPTFSIVMPAFNSANTIEQAIATLREQSELDWELIVVDDGSTDKTGETISRVAAEDPRVKLRSQPNGGPSAARNNGISAAAGKWLIFLDSDDSLRPNALTVWRRAIDAHPRTRWFNGVCSRVIGDGEGVPFGAVRLEDPQAAFAVGCPIAIHACLVDRALAVQVEGFDPGLRTCEDWDFWRRVAATGERPTFVDAEVAEYRMQSRSAATYPRQLLTDGLTVIDRAHASPGLELDRLAARAAFSGYVGAMSVGQGLPTRWILDVVGRESAPDLNPDLLADFLLVGTAVGRLEPIEAWPRFAEQVVEHLEVLLESFEAHFKTRALPKRTLRRLAARVAAVGSQVRVERPVAFGAGVLVDIDIAHGGHPPAWPPERDFIHVRGWFAGRAIVHADVALFGDTPSEEELIDALLEADAWTVLEAVVLRPLLPEIEVRRLVDGTNAAVRRGVALGQCPQTPTDRELLDAVAWPLFMQELGAAFSPDGAPSRRRTLRALLGSRHRFGGSVSPVALADLPNLWVWRPSSTVHLMVGGAVVDVFSVRRRRGPYTRRALASKIVERNGASLVWIVLRAYLASTPSAGTPLLAGLADSERRMASAVVDAHARRIQLRPGAGPHPARLQRRIYRGRASRLVTQASGAAPDLVVSGTGVDAVARSPLIDESARPTAAPQEPAVGRLNSTAAAPMQRGAADFEAWFAAADDPWDYTSGYERTKYQQTLAALPEACGRTLEIGCAEGHFTEMLASRTTELLGTDVSTVALERASKRCAAFEQVTFARHDLFREPLDGRWDTVICSETLYYVGSVDALASVVDKLARAVVDGGIFVTAHANLVVDDPTAPGFDWDEAFGAATIERSLLASGRFALEASLETPMYRVQRYRRVTTPAAAPPMNVRRVVEASADLSPSVRAGFLPHGGSPSRTSAAALQLPILMFHRLAPDGATSMRRYRTDPEQFDAQLRYLRDAGFTSITPEQWRDAVLSGGPLPPRPVWITFDDGFQDFADHAAPALLRYDFTATVMLVTDLVGGVSEWDRGRESRPLMNWATIQRLHREGFSFGAHTRTHPHLTGVSSDEALDQISGSITAIAERLGALTVSFAYPYGDVTEGVRSMTGACGVGLGLSCDPGLASERSDLLRLPRIEVRGDRDLRDFISALGAR